MIINSLDLGGKHPYPTPIVGQTVGLQIIEGYEQSIWPRGSVPRKQTVRFWIRAWQAIGGQSADTAGALKYLLKQIEELAGSRDQQPVYIQWTATAQPSQINTTDSHDGWYVIDDFEPTYQGVDFPLPMADCKMTVTHIAAAPPRRVALAHSGGALATNYAAVAAANLLELPYGSFAHEASFSRTHATGIAPLSILSPIANPESFTPPAALSNYFASGVRVFDTVNTGTNPVPLAGLYVNANWVEVFGTDHNFIGDCVITNGLLLLVPQPTGITLCYFWDTTVATPAWQGGPNLQPAGIVLRSYSLDRVGAEEAGVTTICSDGANIFHVRYRLQRGRYEVRMDFRDPLGAYAQPYRLLAQSFTGIKISYNSTNLRDPVLDLVDPFSATDYGFGAYFFTSPVQHAIFGWLTQNQTTSALPYWNVAGGYSGPGDTVSQPINTWRSYAFFAIPFGTNGVYSTSNLQGECESFTLSGGFANVVDAGSSGGRAAKLPSGTAVGAIALGPGAALDAGATGSYDLWIRIRVTSAASATAQLRLGWYDGTAGAYVASNDFSPSNFTTSYGWYRVLNGFGVTGNGHSQEFRAISVTNAAATDFWLDEMALVPRTLSLDNRGPQDLWQQFMYDRSVRWVRP